MDTTRFRFLPRLIGSLLLVTLAGFSACTPEDRNFGEGGGGGSSSSSSGTMQQCSTEAECGANDECQSFTCEDGLCKVNFTAMGVPVALQALGDCQSNVCDGNGYVVTITDLADPVDDGNPCTLDACVGTETQHGFLASGTACQANYFCNGFGACVECLDSTQCGSSVCTVTNECAAPECSDNVLNGIETDVDCGGLQCPQCAPGAICAGNPDCKSLVCLSGLCAEPNCMDGVKNGSESDVDCGGPGCGLCAPGGQCNAGLDCSSQVCGDNVCLEPACDDQIMNGNETDVDCGGGSLCPKCANGRGCYVGKDCSSGQCCIQLPGDLGYCEKLGNPCLLVARPEISQ